MVKATANHRNGRPMGSKRQRVASEQKTVSAKNGSAPTRVAGSSEVDCVTSPQTVAWQVVRVDRQSGLGGAEAGSRLDRGSRKLRAAQQTELKIQPHDPVSSVESLEMQIEKLTATNEALRLANEEWRSANEVLIASNEILEERCRETKSINSDVLDLLASANIGLLVLGPDQRIRRFTAEAAKLFRLVDADVGRSIAEVATRLDVPDFPKQVTEVMASLGPKDIEARDDEGHWWSVRIRPFQTSDRTFDGATVTLVPVDRLKQREERMRRVLNTALDAIVTMEIDGTITGWNRQAEHVFGCKEQDAFGRNFETFIASSSRAGYEQLLLSCSAGGDRAQLVRRIELTARHTSGREFPLELAMAPIELANRPCFSVFARDISDRKAAEEALRRTKEELEQRVFERTLDLTRTNEQIVVALDRMDDLYQHAPCGYHSVDAAGLFVQINDTALRWLGYSRAELVGQKTVFDIQTAASRTVGQEAFRRLNRGEAIHDLQLELVRKDGSLLTVSLNATPVMDSAGHMVRSRSAFLNVTDRVRVQRALAQSEARLQAILDCAPATIFLKDLQGRYQLINRAFERSADLTETKVIGRTDAELFPRSQAIAVRANDRAVLRMGCPHAFQETAASTDGCDRTSLVVRFPLRDSRGEIIAVGGIGIDVTPTKQAEAALRNSEAKFRGFVESAPDAIVMIDARGEIQLVNAETERLFGFKREELLGCPVEKLMPSQFKAKPLGRRRGHPASFGTNQKARQLELGLPLFGRRKDGWEFPIEVRLSPLQTDSGALICAAIRDITERKRIEDDLRKSKEHYFALFKEAREAHRKMQMLSGWVVEAQEKERKRFSRDLHDIVGQELTAISLTLKGLNRNGSCHRADQRKLETAQGLLRSVIETVHDFARELRPSVLDELGLVPALRSTLITLAERTGLRTHLRADLDVEHLTSEEKLVLFRVSQECLNNVVKHAQASRVDVRISQSANGITLTVADNGRSFKASRDGSSRRQGLGLLGMQERVRLVNGRFKLRPRPGRGTTVRVLIPAKSPAVRTAADGA